MDRISGTYLSSTRTILNCPSQVLPVAEETPVLLRTVAPVTVVSESLLIYVYLRPKLEILATHRTMSHTVRDKDDVAGW